MKATSAADHIEVGEPQLPHQHKRPRRYEEGSSVGSFHSTPKDYYCHHYFEAVDLIITCINDLFDQQSYRIYHQLEELLLKASKQEDFKSELEFVRAFYKEDLKVDLLQTQLSIFAVADLDGFLGFLRKPPFKS